MGASGQHHISTMLVVSFIRHGESFDNIKLIWAGHKDGELSELGVRQAKALGESYASTRLDAVVTSDLKRAHATAMALLNAQPDPKPLLKVDRDLREQYLGDAEGHPFLVYRIPDKSLDDHFRDGQYPILFGRNERFPNGESLGDLAIRAERFIEDLVLKPYLSRAISSGPEHVHIAVVSHGLCINELIAALLKRNDGGSPTRDYKGLQNTAWTRVTVQVKLDTQISQRTDELGNLPPLIIMATDVNQHEHLTDMKCQKGIVDDPDPEQQSIREFFGGVAREKPVKALGHAESNATNGVRIEKRDSVIHA